MAAPPPSTRELRERAADTAVRAISSVPPLALLAVAAALVELVLARAVWHGMTDALDPTVLFEIRRLARFPRNLAAVAGMVAALVALIAFLRLPGYASIGRRLAVAAFSGIFLPSVAVAALLPAPMLRRKLVIFGLAAANVLVALIALTATRYRPERLLRVALGLASATSLLTLTAVGLGQLAQAQRGFWGSLGALMMSSPSTTERVLLAIRHTGEVCWMAVLITGALVAIWDRGASKVRARVAAGVAITVALCAALVVLEAAIGHRFRFLLFGSFRLGLLVDDAPLVYVVPLALGLAGGLVAIVRADPGMRQLGAGMLAWLAAGFAPHTPIQLLYLVLGALLLARAGQARDPEGAWRRHQPWARLTGRRPAPVEDPGGVTDEPTDAPRLERGE